MATTPKWPLSLEQHPLTDPVPAVLLSSPRGDGPLVVAAEKEHGAGQGGGHVEASVKVALAGGALSLLLLPVLLWYRRPAGALQA